MCRMPETFARYCPDCLGLRRLLAEVWSDVRDVPVWDETIRIANNDVIFRDDILSSGGP
jgi:hypothetical protein